MKTLMQNLVVAVSGSDASINAAKYAIVLAKQYGCTLTAVYVVDTATLKQLVITKIFVEEESADYERSLEANGMRYLNYIRDLGAQKGVTVETVLKKGKIYSEIIQGAAARQANLIIPGGWERERKERDIISDSHREILLNARCSVLVAKEQDIEKIYDRL